MKSKLLLALLLVSSTWAWDEFTVIEPKAISFNVAAYKPLSESGEAAPRIGAKVGLITGLDIEYKQAFYIQSSPRGIERPNLALKYSLPMLEGASLLAGVSLPFGTEAVASNHGTTGVELAGLYNFPFLGADANAFVTYRADVDALSEGVGELYLDPTWKLRGRLSFYQATDLSWGKGGDPMLGLWPGLDYGLGESSGICADLDFDIALNSGNTDIGVSASLYTTF